MKKHANIPIFIPHKGCPHDCIFCNQKKIAGQIKAPDVNEINDFIEKSLKTIDKNKEIQIAFFGGSFTGIDEEEMISYLKIAYSYIEKGYVSGIRISTRPDYIDKRILDILKKYGVNSIELGVQSMDNKVLSLCERGHTSKDVIDAVKLIKEYDFELVLQMMCNLYGSKHDDVFETGKKIAALKPDGVRIYPTMVIKNTALEQLYRSGKYIPENLENTVEICAKLYMLFYENDINVLRMGLYSDKAKEKIRDGKFKDKDIEIFVKPGSISKMAGNKRYNVTKLLKEFCIKSIKIKEDSTLSDFEVKIFEKRL